MAKVCRVEGFQCCDYCDLDLPLASGAVKVMAKTLQKVSEPMAWPGSDFRCVFEPSAPVEVGCFCYIFDSIVYLFD